MGVQELGLGLGGGDRGRVYHVVVVGGGATSPERVHKCGDGRLWKPFVILRKCLGSA